MAWNSVKAHTQPIRPPLHVSLRDNEQVLQEQFSVSIYETF
jgi:hypothetical protein